MSKAHFDSMLKTLLFLDITNQKADVTNNQLQSRVYDIVNK